MKIKDVKCKDVAKDDCERFKMSDEKKWLERRTYEDDFAVVLMLEDVKLLVHKQVDVALLLATTVAMQYKVSLLKPMHLLSLIVGRAFSAILVWCVRWRHEDVAVDLVTHVAARTHYDLFE